MVVRAWWRPKLLRPRRQLREWLDLCPSGAGPLGCAEYQWGGGGGWHSMPDMSYPGPGGAVPGYLAVPAARGPWPGVVVIHEAFGLSDDIRRKADELAAQGYLALAPDLYGGRSWLRCVKGVFGQLRQGAG